MKRPVFGQDEPVRGPLDTSDFEFERRKINIRALREAWRSASLGLVNGGQELWLEVLTLGCSRTQALGLLLRQYYPEKPGAPELPQL